VIGVNFGKLGAYFLENNPGSVLSGHFGQKSSPDVFAETPKLIFKL
jgi:hypothetical protein